MPDWVQGLVIGLAASLSLISCIFFAYHQEYVLAILALMLFVKIDDPPAPPEPEVPDIEDHWDEPDPKEDDK